MDAFSGITASLSNDKGDTWEPHQTLISINWSSDHGYPSNVELKDGSVLTVYYWGGRATEGQYGGRDDLPDNLGLLLAPRLPYGSNPLASVE
ncbi:MAG: sialidase family protein [Planctomycetaceae bacterium]